MPSRRLPVLRRSPGFPDGPPWPCAVLLVTGALCVLLSGIAWYGQRTVVDERAFADRATATLSQDEVDDEIVARIGQRLVDAHPELATRRPVLDAAAHDLVTTPAFAAEFHSGVAAMHHALFTDSRAPVRLVMPGAGRELLDMVEYHSKASAREVPATDPELFAIGGGGRLERTLRSAAPVARRLTRLAPLALAAGLVALTLAVLRAAALLLVAVLLLTAPAVPINLALVALAGALVFSAAAEIARLRLLRSPAD